MISVITPTNNPCYLAEAYQSLQAQTYQDWEWVIVPNGGASWITCQDERVRVFPLYTTGSVGAIKRLACERVKGDIIAELDHDDLLTPTALEQVAKAFDGDPELGMVYSNFAEFNMPDWGPNCYNAIYGWRYRPCVFYGRVFQEARAFPPVPSTFMSLAFGPNHLRAWRTSEYWKVGGHDPTIPVADDHDLYCRFYIHSKMRHIDDCLYLYRNHPTQTWRVMYDQVQSLAWQISDKYRVPIVERWAKLEGLPMVDLGGGFGKPEGYIGLDLHGGDILADARQGLPFAESSVGVIRAHDFLEHLPDKVGIMNEIYRVLTPNGWLLSQTPSTDGRGAFQDPTHVSYWNQNSFWYYTNAGYAKYAPAIKCRFQAKRLMTYFPFDWQRQNNIPYVLAHLVALKGDERVPGLVEI